MSGAACALRGRGSAGMRLLERQIKSFFQGTVLFLEMSCLFVVCSYLPLTVQWWLASQLGR